MVVDQRRRLEGGINDAATKKVADYWGGLVEEGAIDNQPMYTPEWNKALNNGTLIAWPARSGRPGVLTGNAPTPGQVGDGAAAAVDARRERHRQLGRLVDRRHGGVQAQGRRGEVRDLAEHRPRGARRARQGGRHLPGSDAARQARPDAAAGVLLQPARLLPKAAEIAEARRAASPSARTSTSPTAPTRTRSPRPPRRSKSAFAAALDQMQTTTLDDMKKNAGFTASRALPRQSRTYGIAWAPYVFLAPAIILFSFPGLPIGYAV